MSIEKERDALAAEQPPAPLAFAVGAVVRQYHDASRRRYDDATVTCVHGNGALDVLGADGQPYGWSESVCEVIRAAPAALP